jgi:lipoyl(octanoyl) transferase
MTLGAPPVESAFTHRQDRLAMITETLMCSAPAKLRRDDSAVEWIVSEQPVGYPEAMEAMRQRAIAIARDEAPEAVWLLEHPPLYTAGTSAAAADLLQPDRFPVYETGRGGEYTYHGPGQRVAYTMLDLRHRGRDVRCLVNGLEAWIIDTLAAFNVKGERREGRIGVWVGQPGRIGGESKIAAIGVRVSRWVTTHGIALNVSPDLGHFSGIVPCGISDKGVTSLEDLGQIVSMAEADIALRNAFERAFGPTVSQTPETLVTTA